MFSQFTKRVVVVPLLFALLFLHGAVGLSSSSSQLPPCDVSSSPKDFCQQFCTYQCGFYNTSAGETGRDQNVTLYRITPRNVTGVTNKNTADAAGDVSTRSLAIYEISILLLLVRVNCSQHDYHTHAGQKKCSDQFCYLKKKLDPSLFARPHRDWVRHRSRIERYVRQVFGGNFVHGPVWSVSDV